MHIVFDSLTQRAEGTWRLSYHPVFDDGSCGERIFETIKAPTRRSAKKKAGEIRVQRESEYLNQGEEPQRCGTTLREWTEQVTDEAVASRRIQVKTAESYKIAVNACELMADVDLADLTVPLAKESFASMLAEGKRSEGTCIRYFKHARAMVDEAVLEGIVTDNPLRRVRLPKKRPRKARALTGEEGEKLAEIMRAASGLMKTAIALGRYLGVRSEEACGFRWVDRYTSISGQRFIMIDRAICVEKGRVRAKCPKTESSRRSLPEIDELSALLDERMREQQEAARAHNVKWSESMYILGGVNGLPMNPKELGRQFRAMCDAVDLDCTYHKLRHTFATRMIALGVDVRTVARWLGHSDPGFTLRVYCDADDQALFDSIDKVRLII